MDAESSVQSVLHQNIRIQSDHPRVAKVTIRSHQQCPDASGGIRKPPWTRQVFRELETLKTCAPDCHGTGIVKSCFAFLLRGCCFGRQFSTYFHVYLPCIFHPIYIFGEFRSPNLAPFPTFQGLPGCKRWPWERSYYHILFLTPWTQHGHFPKFKNTLKILAKLHCPKGKIVNQRRDVSLSWEKTCQFSIAEFIVRWPGGVFMMPVKIHFFRVSIWTWMWKKHFSIFSEFTCLNVQRNFVQPPGARTKGYRTYESKFRQETSSNPLYLWFASCHPVVFLHHKHHVRPCGWAVEVSMLPWNWVNWAKVRYVKDEKGLTKSLSRFEMWFWRI